MIQIHPGLSVAEFAAIVSGVLANAGLNPVLSGGSVVTIYAGNEWQSYDLDFVVERVDRKRIAAILRELGFVSESVRSFSHPNHSQWVEVLTAPVMLGEEFAGEWGSLPTPVGVLSLLTPTQCVKDRLTGFYHAHDRQSLDQAVAVSVKCDVSLDEIVRWSESERAEPRSLKEFLDAVERERRRGM